MGSLARRRVRHPPHSGWQLTAYHQPASSKVAVLNLHTMTIEHQINVPPAPQEILLRPDRKVAYVSCDRSKQVAEIDLASWKVNRLINVGAGADGLAWAASGD